MTSSVSSAAGEGLMDTHPSEEELLVWVGAERACARDTAVRLYLWVCWACCAAESPAEALSPGA